jgi:hypothetical protein
MKRHFLLVVTMGVALLALFGFSWAQCPEDTVDLGICDTFYVEAWAHTDTCWGGNCGLWKINNPGSHFPCFLYVNLFVTHDSNRVESPGPYQGVLDSIVGIVVPLKFWHQPVGVTDADSMQFPTGSNFNNTRQDPEHSLAPKSIFRHFIDSRDGDTLYYNRIAKTVGDPDYFTEWTLASSFDDISASPGDSGLLGMGNFSADGSYAWDEGNRELLHTFTFIVYMEDGDTTEVCFDTSSYGPGNVNKLEFTRVDAINYKPRHFMPLCFKVYGDTVEGGLPPSGVRWIEGTTEEEAKPTSFLLSQNYPNPFNPTTNFKFTLPQACHVKIEIFNILGQKVKTLVDEDMRSGVYLADWDGKDQRGAEASSGIYFYRIRAGEFSDIKRMVLLK